ncbi:MAG TPA: signal peptidase I [Rectinemataceae bacterium]|nr:signal peptidase I [Rectinemataceae bacterium]
MASRRRKSYTEKVEGRRKFLARAGLFFLVFLGFELVSGLFLKTYAITSTSMSPNLLPGDRLLVSPLPFGPLTIFGKMPPFVRPGRGDLVIIRPPFVSDTGVVGTFVQSLVRFVTFQLYAPAAKERDPAINGPFVARVIGLPGDLVSMDDFVFKVRPADSTDALTEFEFSAKRYDIHKPVLPASWQSGYPLSGSMKPYALGKGEYFVASDDRGLSADSRTWGPVGSSSFEGKVLLLYWPFKRFGSP